MIVFHVEHMAPGWGVDDDLIERAIAATVEEARLTTEPEAFADDYELSIVLSDDAHVRELNGQWRGKDAATNVLSFPVHQIAPGARPPEPMLGDLVFARETCEREAGEQGKTVRDHFTHLLVHGLLHLYGHDHDSDGEAEAMEDLERRVLARLGIADPYAAMDGAAMETEHA